MGFLSILVLMLGSGDGQSQIRTLETRDLRLLYLSKQHEFIVQHAARSFENALAFHHTMYDFTPTEKVTVLIEDFGDFGNGAATGVPANFIMVGISPFQYTYETIPVVERMTWMMNHELTHIVTMDKPSPSSAFYRSIFQGKVAPMDENPLTMIYSYLTSPRLFAPRWFFEGQAVFMETWMNGGLGRAQGAYDEMMFRTMVRDNSYFYDVVGLEAEGTKVDFQVGAASYLYGTRFLSYLAYNYGPEKVVAWNNQDENSRNAYDSRFEQVYGTSLDDEWEKWINWEHGWQQTNLDLIREYPTTSYRVILDRALGSVSRTFFDSKNNKLYAAVNYPGQVAHIASLDLETGARNNLKDIRGGALFYVSSLAYDSVGQKLFFTTDNNRWRDVNVYDLTTGSSHLLIKNARTGDFAFNHADRSLWGVRHYNGLSSLVRMPAPYTEWNTVHFWPYGQDIFDIDISPDGKKIIGALGQLDGTQKLIMMDTERLLAGEFSFEVLEDFEDSTPANFVFSQDGRYLFGSSFYSGVSNIVRYDLETGDIQYITNCETGLFRPVPISEDSLVAFLYTGKGFLPVMIANEPIARPDLMRAIRYLGTAVVDRNPVLETWHVPPPTSSNVRLDTMIVYEGEYHPLENVSLASLYPVVEGYKEFVAFGLRADFSDPIQSHMFDITAAYSPNTQLPMKERFHGMAGVKVWNWRGVITYNGADFYDLFGPTKTSRKGISAGLEHKDYLFFDEPETLGYRARLGGFWRLERLPDYQAVGVAYDRFYSLSVELNYRYLEKSLGAVEDEKGFAVDLVSPTNLIRGTVFPRIYANASLGFLLPINHSSIWIRGSAGKAFGPRTESLANFYFGGFGNNWIDHGSVWRYREQYSFPGLPIDRQGEIAGTNYGKLMFEWTLPPVHFGRFGVRDFYFNWGRVSLFTSGIITNADDSSVRREFSNAGLQLDFRTVLFSSLQSTISVGYAVAVEFEQRYSDEFMISLKIL